MNSNTAGAIFIIAIVAIVGFTKYLEAPAENCVKFGTFEHKGEKYTCQKVPK